jgi:lysophospholipid acyltransferase (LPLAT)-like uncharacterized protein
MPEAVSSSSGKVVPQALPWHRRLAAIVAAAMLRVCLKTWRVRWLDSGGVGQTNGPVIFCVWHNRLPAALASYDDFVRSRWPSKGMAAMISASRDGGLLANVLERFGIKPIRGSTSRRGPQALLEATSWMEADYHIVITPDGPRGPVYQIQGGIIDLAQVTGRPIIPTSNFTRWKIRFGSWDQFQLPLPFAHLQAVYGEPIWVQRDASVAQREELRGKLEICMRGITRD